VTTDQLFELPALPKRVGVLGLGAIGLEMGLALSRLGVEVIGADVANMVAGIVDPVIGERAIARFGREITLWLGSEVSVSASGEEVLMRSGDRVAKVDLLLAALGRRPNVDSLNLEAAGIAVDARGMPEFDPATMRIGDFPVFIAGDANGDRPLMHEAADEGAIAGYNAARADVTRFRRKVALGIAFADPDVVSVGARLDQLDPQAIAIGSAGGDSNGRAKILGSEESLLRLYADARDGRLLGAAMVAAGGEHLAHLLAWAIQRGETAQGLLQLPFYHPVVEEMLQTALKEIAQKFPDGLPSGLARA
jgi:dihydrolipoamide dehydrogenase